VKFFLQARFVRAAHCEPICKIPVKDGGNKTRGEQFEQKNTKNSATQRQPVQYFSGCVLENG
jgi:hypothetical protein